MNAVPPQYLAEDHAVPGCEQVVYVPAFIEPEAADAHLATLVRTCAWRRETLTLFGRRMSTPRLTAWYGDPGCGYRYSGVAHAVTGWTPVLAALRDRITQSLDWRPNFVLANRYRDGQDCMGWHADDEPALGPSPMIVSLSFGAVRRFRLRRRDDHGTAQSLALEHGSLLLMWGSTQREWQHCLPRSRRVHEERINLTFRRVLGN